MAKRPLKNRTPINNAVANEIWTQFDELHKTSRINKSLLLDEALTDLFKKYTKLSNEKGHSPADT